VVYYGSNNVATGVEEDIPFAKGEINLEIHKFYRANENGGSGAGSYIYSTYLSINNIVTGATMMVQGAIASKISPSQGYARSWEVAQMGEGDNFAIRHVLKLGGSLSMFRYTSPLGDWIWPANNRDGHASSGNYTGPLEYGTAICLPSDFNVNTFVEARVASEYWSYAKSYLNAYKYFGGVFLITSGSGNLISHGAEPLAPMITSSQRTAILTCINAAIPLMRVISNYHTPGTLLGN